MPATTTPTVGGHERLDRSGMTKRPNFILFVTDQHRADYLGCMGHPVLQTPNIDAMAAKGTVWDRFYVASPVCMPNRSSLMTCRMPSSHDVRCNGISLDKRNVTFVELLRDGGYRTALIGKSHLQNNSGKPPMLKKPAARDGYHEAVGPLAEGVRQNPPEHIEDEKDPATIDTPYFGFDHVELATGHGDRLAGHYRSWLLEKEPNADDMIGAENQLPHDYACPQAVRTALPEDLYPSAWIADRAVSWIEEQGDEPWFLMVSFPDPHHPFNPPGKYWDMYSPDDMPVPQAFKSNDWAPPPHVKGMIDQREAGDANLAGMGTIGTTAREAQEAQALTCGMISMIDDCIGRVRAASGAADAVQIFTTDHGDHLGDHKLLFKGAEQYEQITHVPMIWSDPTDQTSTRTDAIGQTLDLGTTILDRARVEPAIGMQGISLLNEKRDYAFIQYDHQKTNPGLGIGPRVHTIRDARWRISVFDNVEWGELYDLENDPRELVNLWESPDHANIRAHLILKLARAEIACVDRTPFPTSQA